MKLHSDRAVFSQLTVVIQTAPLTPLLGLLLTGQAVGGS